MVTSLVLSVVLGLLALTGWYGFQRLRGSQDRLEAATVAVAGYADIQRVVADELAAEAAWRRSPGPDTRADLSAALVPPAEAIRRAGLDAASTASLLVLQETYATEVLRASRTGSADEVSGATVAEMQRLLADGHRDALHELDLATARQRVVVGQMTWRAPLALVLSALVLGLCWRLLLRYSSRAMARAQQSEQLAMRDPLTGLANRRAFERELAREMAQDPPDCAVLLLDLDGFKSINDTWGHDVGDKVLTTVADRLCSTVRATDLVARIGGDEFAVLARPALHLDALKDRLAEAVARPMPVSGVLLHPSASVGCAAVGPGQAQADVLRAADLELYDVKRTRLASGRRLGARQVSH